MKTPKGGEGEPHAGDVIFVLTKEKQSLVSCLAQILIDKQAVPSGRWFSHVALGLGAEVALEASTAPGANDPPTWSGAELEGGVRLITLPDLLVPAESFAVLRPPARSVVNPASFCLSSKLVAGVYGSEYSIQALQEGAEGLLGPAAKALTDRGWFQWTSDPDDLATRFGFDKAFRERISEALPDYEFSFASRSFFCSQLVSFLLTEVGLLAPDPVLDNITPTGLHRWLLTQGWSDVTATAYSDTRIENWDRSNTKDWKLVYLHRVGEVKVARMTLGNSEGIDLLGKTLAAFSDSLKKRADELVARYKK